VVPINELKAFAFLKEVNDDQLNKLANLAGEESYLAGTQLYQNGDAARSLFLVKEGKIVLFIDH
jgi:hypothetical protein